MIKFDLKFVEWRGCERSKAYVAVFGYDRFIKECTCEEVEYHAGEGAKSTPLCDKELEKAMIAYKELQNSPDFKNFEVEIKVAQESKTHTLKFDDLSDTYSFEKSFHADRAPLTSFGAENVTFEDDNAMCPDANFAAAKRKAA